MDLISPSIIKIPEPRKRPIIGNLHLMDTTAPVQSIVRIAKDYDGIFRLTFFKNSLLIITTQELVDELCDESRFDKKISRPLELVSAISGDGLFTAKTTDPTWGKAHRILMSAFGPTSLRGMTPGMLDIAEQMLLKWERMGDGHVVDITDNMTRLTLDTIALTAFGFRFNSFYETTMHPFIDAMVRGLGESSLRARRPNLATRLKFKTFRQYERDKDYLHELADKIVAERRNDPDRGRVRDLLSIMLDAKDPVTGEGLDDANIRYQMVTFLIAGHETTSGMLSFAIYALLKNPEVLKKAREEIDAVLGTDAPRFEDVAKLVYLDQIFKETLRIWPTAPAFSLQSPHEDTIIGGRYRVKAQETLMVIVPILHRDPKVWKDPDAFHPERMAPELFKDLPPNAWKPFGNGQRACIGRAFAMQEAILVLAMVLQRYELELKDPAYQLQVKETLTLKPEGLYVRIKRRESFRTKVSHRDQISAASITASAAGSRTTQALPLRILFGSNTGSSEAFAERLAADARTQGYEANLSCMNAAIDQLHANEIVIIITASYEGLPPDNAKTFVAWLEGLAQGSLKGMKFAVFGCGNKDWARTYQAVPTHVDQLLENTGGLRLASRGEADARGDFFGDFDRWYAAFRTILSEASGQVHTEITESSDLTVEFIETAAAYVGKINQALLGTILENIELTPKVSGYGRSRRHIEIALPSGLSYRAGDYLTILPKNADFMVERVLKRFDLSPSSLVKVQGARAQNFPLDCGLQLDDLLAHSVELAQPATRSQITKLANLCPCPPDAKALRAFIVDDAVYAAEILDKRVSVLDLLERYRSCALPFAAYLTMLPALKPRQYSISSSPLWRKDRCTLSIAVVGGEAWSGTGRFAGVASQYLAAAAQGASVRILTKPSHPAFHLPDSPQTPIIMICAGTGIAPFRGFLQERAYLKMQGAVLGAALLFFGCRHPEEDFLYKSELRTWEDLGIVSVMPAFSRGSETGISYVQDKMWQERDAIRELLDLDAKIYVCGDGRRMAPAVKTMMVRIHRGQDGSIEEAEQWLRKMETTQRYAVDLFS